MLLEELQSSELVHPPYPDSGTAVRFFCVTELVLKGSEREEISLSDPLQPVHVAFLLLQPVHSAWLYTAEIYKLQLSLAFSTEHTQWVP